MEVLLPAVAIAIVYLSASWLMSDYMDPDSLLPQAKIIKAQCGGGQPTPRRSMVTLRAAYEILKKTQRGRVVVSVIVVFFQYK